MSARSVTLGFAVALALVGAGLAAPAHAAVPYTPPAHIAGTAGQFNKVSATAPDGTDLVLWIAASTPSGYQINARVRGPGGTVWKPIAAGVRDRVSIQDIVVAPTGAGDFEVAWTEYGAPAVFTARVSSAARSWSRVRQVFHDDAFTTSIPSIDVAADGTVVIVASAKAVDPGSPLVYRVVVGVQRSDGTFARTYLSPDGEFAVAYQVSVSPDGRILVPFVAGYNTADRTVMAATRGPGSSGPWSVTPLSVAGDATRVTGSIGDGGMAAVAWTAPASGTSAVRLSTAQIGTTTPAWSGRDVSTSGGTPSEPGVAVDRDGDVTVLWNANGSDAVTMARQLIGATLGPPLALSPSGRLSSVGTITMRPDGRVAVLSAQYTTGSIDPLGLRLVLLRDGLLVSTTELTTSTDGEHNQFALGVDAASRGTVVYTRGDPSADSDLAWLGQAGAAPAVMTSRYSGRPVQRATVAALPRHRLRCDSGFWVEAQSTSYAWFRGTARIRGAKDRAYHWTAQDAGRRLSCRVVGRSELAQRSTSLTSAPRTVG